ncbi:MAG: hypothetical protein KAR20_13530 [Candidatus Heimdallarchaeota archaeon]|nr:hypothetical protein [Candidatus Heimdallarchaeota archaeon]
MPAKWFIEGDKKYEITDVLSGKIEMNFPLPYLIAVGNIREWDGHLHVTDLYNGMRETFLRYTTLFAIDPDDMAFAVAGQFKHNVMEDENNPFHEKQIIYRNILGQLDLLDKRPNGEYGLTDYKNQGAFAVRKFMGWVKKYTPEIDSYGVPVKFKSGKRAGQQKYKSEWILDPTKADRFQYEFQLNIYRKAIEESLGITISKLKIFFMLRDGGLAATREQGLTKNTYFEDVKMLDDETINAYIDSKSGTAQNIIEFQTTEGQSQDERWLTLKRLCPPLCSEKERWHNKETGRNTKCEKYCPVSELCGRIH